MRQSIVVSAVVILLAACSGGTGPDVPECHKDTYFRGTATGGGTVVEDCTRTDNGEDIDCDACLVTSVD